MASALKKAKKGQAGAVLNTRYKWVEFTAENEDGDDVLIRCRVRSSLLNREIEMLSAADVDGPAKHLWEMTAPYVVEWNVLYQDEAGDLFEVLPPAQVGPDAFQYAPPELVLAIIGSLVREPFRAVDPKSLTPVESTDAK